MGCCFFVCCVVCEGFVYNEEIWKEGVIVIEVVLVVVLGE